MEKIFNLLLILLILVFFSSTYKFYSSKNNIEIKNFNRNNLEKIMSSKTLNLPVLKNDTNNVIEFNDGFSNEIKDEKPRSFWNLLKSK